MRIAPPPRRPLPVTLTSLIDVVCVLLIFFMLATTFSRMTVLPLDLAARPAPATTTALPGPAPGAVGAVLVRVTPEGPLDLAGTKLADAAFDAEIAALLAADPGRGVLVHPLEGATLQRVVDVLARLERLGVTAASLTGA